MWRAGVQGIDQQPDWLWLSYYSYIYRTFVNPCFRPTSLIMGPLFGSFNIKDFTMMVPTMIILSPVSIFSFYHFFVVREGVNGGKQLASQLWAGATHVVYDSLFVVMLLRSEAMGSWQVRYFRLSRGRNETTSLAYEVYKSIPLRIFTNRASSIAYKVVIYPIMS